MKDYAINKVDFTQGFGVISMIDSVPLSGKNDMTGEFLDRKMIYPGQKRTFDKLSSGCNSTYEFSVTLVWADTPARTGCMACLLNDLDLEATQETATGTKVHFPNGLRNKDFKNNVERIRFDANPGDIIEVTVRAARLDEWSQSYALAAVTSCKGFARPQSNSKCESLMDSGAYHFQSWWKTSLVYVWFPFLFIMR